tara:strand:- start:395 stop:1036 length:642 start_codon:yes stop_codon:yes gene_type:complete
MNGLGSLYWDEKFLRHLDIENFKYIFEVGARYGDESLALSRIFKESHIYSFEINPLTVNECQEKLLGIKNITFYNLGLGEKDEYLPFYSFLGGNDGASSLLKRKDFSQTQKETGNVKITTLEKIVSSINLPYIDLLCMDVQGFELNILKGASDYISNINYIIMEEPKRGVNSPYIGCPSSEGISIFMKENNFLEIERVSENDIEDNVLYKNVK